MADRGKDRTLLTECLASQRGFWETGRVAFTAEGLRNSQGRDKEDKKTVVMEPREWREFPQQSQLLVPPLRLAVLGTWSCSYAWLSMGPGHTVSFWASGKIKCLLDFFELVYLPKLICKIREARLSCLNGKRSMFCKCSMSYEFLPEIHVLKSYLLQSDA